VYRLLDALRAVGSRVAVAAGAADHERPLGRRFAAKGVRI
jgi:hypothetical protein